MPDKPKLGNGKKVDLTTGLLSLIATVVTTIGIAAVPWAYQINGRLVRIETTLTGLVSLETRIDKLEVKMSTIEINLAELRRNMP